MEPPRPFLFFLTLLVFVGVGVSASTTEDDPAMILLLLDGFRWDYLDIHKSDDGFPGFDKFAEDGVRARYLNPVFPTNSFPNWRTIVTGLYPESHGIVGNYIFDDVRNASFALNDLESTKDPVWWQDAEPLWITATKAEMDTALFLWSSCDVPWEGNVLPKYCTPYEHVADTIQVLLSNLNRGVEMIHQEGYKLIMVYVELIDIVGHLHGPDSSEVKEALKSVDSAMQRLWEMLDEKDMLNTTNVVAVSDHGMAKVSQDTLVRLDVVPCLDSSKIVKTTGHSGFINILPVKGYVDQVEESLKNCPGVSENIEVVRKENMKERYHYKDHRLIHDLTVLAKPGYFLSSPTTTYSLPQMTTDSTEGDHGLDDTNGQTPDMRGILFAAGPSFISGHQSDPVSQVDVYPLLCHALQLPCHPNNGSLDHVEAFFALKTTTSSASTTASGILTMVFLMGVSLMLWLGGEI
ncbi:glycerophosphocholine cholinephosphodiesterase ENPP6-like [Penaeus japonicus]|uniref:glycerophosphocholine cholinephosphodiesterase ENPP6-like n=1 Tax=Penaeus japonicus TaxID=27405 RepID=UPI001C710E6C|nr:glycerophosphocholine cholinephosphodiesterase ENPP6-like [Penaeus japonicus]